jgi:hypothetical protein
MLSVKLYDRLGYLVHTTKIPGALPKVIIWGNEAFVKKSKRTYQQTTLYVLKDTR